MPDFIWDLPVFTLDSTWDLKFGCTNSWLDLRLACVDLTIFLFIPPIFYHSLAILLKHLHNWSSLFVCFVSVFWWSSWWMVKFQMICKVSAGWWDFCMTGLVRLILLTLVLPTDSAVNYEWITSTQKTLVMQMSRDSLNLEIFICFLFCLIGINSDYSDYSHSSLDDCYKSSRIKDALRHIQGFAQMLAMPVMNLTYFE